jgi:hypothetical protein
MSSPHPTGPTPANSSPYDPLSAIAADHRHGDPLDRLLRVLLDAGSELGIIGVTAHVLRRNSLVVAADAGLSDDDADIARVLPLVAPFPVTDCVRLGIPVILADQNQLTTHYPSLIGFDAEAVACMPIDRSARTVGALSVVFDRPITRGTEMSTALATVSRFCAAMREFDHH